MTPQREKLEENTVESKKGRLVFYFSEDDTRGLFKERFQIEDLREIQEEIGS